MNNENIFSLQFTEEHIVTTCKHCGKDLRLPIRTQGKDAERLITAFRIEHENDHDVIYDPGQIVRQRKK